MEFSNVYFMGIGGIGMSGIARWFMHEGKNVGGYDRTETPLTRALAAEGASVHYEDDPENIPATFRDPANTLVVYTPAVPKDSPELCWLRENGFEVLKRSEILGHISAGKYVMAVAGTHGKTTTTTMLAWFNHVAAAERTYGYGCPTIKALMGDRDSIVLTKENGVRDGNGDCGTTADPRGGSAFLGGISVNFNSNFILGEGNRLAVEADEYDRSFLRLYPDAAVITSVDPDHLDIYGDHDSMKEAFLQFTDQIRPGGAVILNHRVDLPVRNKEIKVYKYSAGPDTDFGIIDPTPDKSGFYTFNLKFPDRTVAGCRLGIPGLVNVENAVGAAALMWVAGVDDDKLREAMSSFRGVKRRFEFYLNTDRVVYMDDYAHHPEELNAAISSVRGMFQERRVTAVFQPHLYSRTNDFYREFARALSGADEVILLPIYPARELPIPGVDSEMIGRLVTVPVRYSTKETLAEDLSRLETDVVVTFGAGDIDTCCDGVYRMLEEKYK